MTDMCWDLFPDISFLKKKQSTNKNLTTNKAPKSFSAMISGGIQCYHDHGAGYTIRRTLYHMGLWADEKAPKGTENRPKLVNHAERILNKKKGK